MTPKKLAEIKRNYHTWPVTELIAEISRLKAQNAALLTTARRLIAYRDAAGPLGFQLEKADDFINALREAAAKAEADGE